MTMKNTAREPNCVSSRRGLHGLMQAIQLPSHFLAVLVLSACVLTIPQETRAQVNPEIANCAELKDEATVTQVDLCSAHIGCRFVLNVQKTCARAKGYIERLQTAIGEGTRTFFGSYRKEVTPDAVFTAALGGEDYGHARKLGGLAQSQQQAEEIGARVRDVGNGDTRTGRNASGRDWIYYGQIRDDKRDGAGTLVFSSGEIQRGQFKGGELSGTGEVLFANGSRYVGNYMEGKREGLHVFRSGKTERGTDWSDDTFIGDQVNVDGTQFKGRIDKGVRVNGRAYRADGALAEEGRYENGKLSVGTQYDVAGVRTEVNLPEVARKAQADRIALELARAAAEIESDKQRKREEAARAEQQFYTSLQTMNPGQLFAKADELNAQGDSARAREVQRSLMSRFPNHPLAATAARQMVGESGASSATSSNTTSSAGARVTVTGEARGHSATFGPPGTTKRTTGARP